MQKADASVLKTSSIQLDGCNVTEYFSQVCTRRRYTPCDFAEAQDEDGDVDVQSMHVNTCAEAGRTSITTRSAHRASQHAKYHVQDAVHHLTTAECVASMGTSSATTAAKAAAAAAAAAMIVPVPQGVGD